MKANNNGKRKRKQIDETTLGTIIEKTLDDVSCMDDGQINLSDACSVSGSSGFPDLPPCFTSNVVDIDSPDGEGKETIDETLIEIPNIIPSKIPPKFFTMIPSKLYHEFIKGSDSLKLAIMTKPKLMNKIIKWKSKQKEQ